VKGRGLGRLRDDERWRYEPAVGVDDHCASRGGGAKIVGERLDPTGPDDDIDHPAVDETAGSNNEIRAHVPQSNWSPGSAPGQPLPRATAMLRAEAS
jgi:hypothetical protein